MKIVLKQLVGNAACHISGPFAAEFLDVFARTDVLEWRYGSRKNAGWVLIVGPVAIL